MTTDDSKDATPDDIIKYYDSSDESQRLTGGFGLFEWERTKELIARYLPGPAATVLDVGGATGVYSFWLAGLGHQVHLVDIVSRHIEHARQTSAGRASPQLASITVGDARALDFHDACADVVLMHGPLYHLTDRQDRVQALNEAKRVLRPGGVLLAFAITRYAGVIFGITRGFVFDADYLRMTREELATGLREDAPAWLRTFRRAHFHHPDELRDEITDSGLVHKRTLGVIGPAWLVPALDDSWADAEKRQTLIDIARMLEHEPVLGPRIMAVARKPQEQDKGGV